MARIMRACALPVKSQYGLAVVATPTRRLSTAAPVLGATAHNLCGVATMAPATLSTPGNTHALRRHKSAIAGILAESGKLHSTALRPIPLPPTTLRGRFITLRPLLPDDLDGLYACIDAGRRLRGDFSRESGGLFEYFSHVVRTKDDLEHFVAASLRSQVDGDELPFVALDNETGEIVGSCRFTEISIKDRRADVSYVFVSKPLQKTTAHSEMLLLLLAHAFEKNGFTRVGFKVDKLNVGAREALTRLGAVEEGTMRQYDVCWPDGRLRDSVVYSILPDEWATTVKARLERRIDRAASARAEKEASAGGDATAVKTTAARAPMARVASVDTITTSATSVRASTSV